MEDPSHRPHRRSTLSVLGSAGYARYDASRHLGPLTMVGQAIRAQRESRRMNPPGAYLLLLFLGYRCGWALAFRCRDG